MRSLAASGCFLIGLACALSVTGCSHATHSKPESGEVPITIAVTPGSGYDDTGAVRSGKAVWLATAVATQQSANTVRVYRWSGTGWSLDGVVRVPETPSLALSGGYLTAASLTGSGAPDFALSTFGADTHWFAVIARIGGKWRTVPFDYRRGPSIGIDAWGVRGNLVRAEVNACGCAAGPETYSWYRFDGRMFAPTQPPGPAAECSPAALDRARPLVVGRGTDVEVLRDLRSPFDVARFACADGWALATGTRHGKQALTLLEQRGGSWLRDAVGSPKQIRAHADEFAVADSLLWRLGARIGKPFGPRLRPFREDFALPRATGPKWEHTAVRVAVTPGSSYADSRVVYRRGRKWLALAVERKSEVGGRRHVLAVHVFRWTGATWQKQTTVHVDVATAHPEGPLQFVDSASLTGSAAPDFTVGPGVPFPNWLAVISDVGGRWQAIPFRTSHGDRVAIDAFPVGGKVVESYENETTKLVYRFRSGSFEAFRRRRDPTCDAALLGRLAEPPLRVMRAACAYGWALATGTRNRQSVVAIFEELGSKWSWLETSQRSRIESFESNDGIPRWVLKPLSARIGSG